MRFAFTRRRRSLVAGSEDAGGRGPYLVGDRRTTRPSGPASHGLCGLLLIVTPLEVDVSARRGTRWRARVNSHASRSGAPPTNREHSGRAVSSRSLLVRRRDMSQLRNMAEARHGRSCDPAQEPPTAPETGGGSARTP